MTRNHKLVSLAMAMVFCMSLLAPLLVAPAVADAVPTITAVTVPTVTVNATSYQTVGAIRIIETGNAFATLDQIVISLPSGVSASPDSVHLDYSGANGLTNRWDSSSLTANTSDPKQIVLTVNNVVTPAGATTDAQIVTISMDCQVTNSGDVLMTINDTGSVIPQDATVLVAKAGNPGTYLQGINKPTVGEGEQTIGRFNIWENSTGALVSGSNCWLVLPEGVTWVSCSAAGTNLSASADATFGTTSKGYSYANIRTTTPSSGSVVGFITIQGAVSIDSTVENGPITIELQSKNGSNFTDGTIDVATKGDFTSEVTVADPPTINAGLEGEKIANVTIKETIAGTLVNGRTINVELPSGYYFVSGSLGTFTYNKGNVTCDDPVIVPKTGDRKISIGINNVTPGTTASEFVWKNAEIGIYPDATIGDITVDFSGSAGITETGVVVAKSQAPITVATDPINDIIIGLKAQPAGNITITEAAAGAILAKSHSLSAYLFIGCPSGVSFGADPTVEVTSGNLKLDTGNIRRVGDNRYLRIPVLTASTGEASTITISDISLVADRTVPEGTVIAKAFGNACDQTVTPTSDDNAATFGTYSRNITTWQLASCVTPAPSETVTEYNATFSLGSTIYYVNGLAKIMDTACFAQDGRVFVPQRYLGMALGIAEENIVWDSATQTATFTTADGKVATCTVGSNILTFDGVDTTMDVQPLVVDNRIFLPARFLTEAMGGTVGWDQATQTAFVNIAI